MNEDLSFYLSFAGFSVGVLALSCTLVLLFGRGGARKILGWTFGLLIIGTIATVAVMWIADARQRSNQLSWQKDPIITPAPHPAPAPQRPLSDAEVGLAANNTATAPPFDPSKPYEVVRPRAAPTGLYEQLAAAEDAEIAWTNSRTPITLDDLIKITHTSRVERLITIEYEVALAADKWTDDHRSDLTRIATKENCDDKVTRKMLDAGFRVRHVFRDPGRLLTYGVTITKYNCSQVSN